MFSQKINQLEKNLNNERNTTTINYSYNGKSSKQISLMKDSQKLIEKPTWIAHRQQFFSTIIASETLFRESSVSTFTPESDKYVKELIAYNRSIDEIEDNLFIDKMIYQEVDDLTQAITKDSKIKELDLSCFTGKYVTGTVTDEYLTWVEQTSLS